MLAQRAQQYITLQENYENRLRNVEKAQEAFGRFKAQATLLGGLGLTLLGALSFAVFGHFIR